MLDLRVIRQDPEKISENCRNRNLPDLVAPLLEQDELARSLKGELDTLRQRRNEISNQMKSKLSTDERQHLIEESKSLKQKRKHCTWLTSQQKSREATYYPKFQT